MTAWDHMETLKAKAIAHPAPRIWATTSRTPAQRRELDRISATIPIAIAVQKPEKRFTSHAPFPIGNKVKRWEKMVQSG